MQIGNRLADLAFGRTNQIPTDTFTTAGLPYDPTSYNLDNMFQRFQPVSFPRDMSQAGPPPYAGGQGAPGGQPPPGGQPSTGGFGQPTPGTPPPATPTTYDNDLKLQYDLVGQDVMTEGQKQLANYERMVENQRKKWKYKDVNKTVADLFEPTSTTGTRRAITGEDENGRPIYGTEASQSTGYKLRYPDELSKIRNMTITNPEGEQFGMEQFLAQTHNAPVDNWQVAFQKERSREFDPSTVNFNWKAPSGFDSTYYSQQQGLAPEQNAWQHYVTNNLGQQNFRPAYPSPTTQAQLAQMLANKQGSTG